MSEFYELKRKQTIRNNDKNIDYWKSKYKAAEARNVQLTQELTVSLKTVSMLEKTLRAIDGIFNAVRPTKKEDLSLIERLLNYSVIVTKVKGEKPEVLSGELEYDDPIGTLRTARGITIDMSLIDGLHIVPVDEIGDPIGLDED